MNFTKITIDTYDVIWFFGFWMVGVLLGVDPVTEWFVMFFMAMLFWFVEPILDRWATRIAERRNAEWLKATLNPDRPF